MRSKACYVRTIEHQKKIVFIRVTAIKASDSRISTNSELLKLKSAFGVLSKLVFRDKSVTAVITLLDRDSFLLKQRCVLT